MEECIRFSQSPGSCQEPGEVHVLPATKITLEAKLKGGAVRRAKPLSGFQRLSTHIGRGTQRFSALKCGLFLPQFRRKIRRSFTGIWD